MHCYADFFMQENQGSKTLQHFIMGMLFVQIKDNPQKFKFSGYMVSYMVVPQYAEFLIWVWICWAKVITIFTGTVLLLFVLAN